MCGRLASTLGMFVAMTAVAVVASGCKSTADLTPNGIWKPTGRTSLNSLTGAEGIATKADGSLVHRGLATIPSAVRKESFKHIGDLDIAKGDTFDSYQGPANSAKMFLVTDADGKRLEYKHPLDPGELFNNSFVTVSPDNQWIVGGEFGVQKRLQVFPAPLLNDSTPKNGGTLPQAGQIALDKPITNIQGCDFFSAERLVCSADDEKKEVFQVDLPHALDGKPVTGKVSSLFTLPRQSKCSGTYEAEGIDFDPKSKVLRAEIVSPGLCRATTLVYSYVWDAL